MIERDRYEPVVTWGNSAGGDWPTVHWAAIQAPAHTFAVFNCGTPSYRIENGSITVSVLRSPQLPHCLVEPYWYITQNHHGMSDYGVHNFRHAICIAEGNWQDNGIGRLGALFNSGLTVLPGELSSPLPAWKLDAQHTQITAVKKSEDGKGVVLRLVELSGKPEAARLSAPAGYSAEKVGLLEDHRQDIPRSGGGFKIDMQPWKIVSVKMTAG